MATLRELTYMVLDELKLSSDDSYFNEEHIRFLIGKYRGLLLTQLYKDVKKEIAESNLQTISVNLVEVPAISGVCCEGGTFLKTVDKIPFLMSISTPRIYADDFYNTEISYVSRERMKYVGNNKWLLNAIYASMGPDNYIYLKSSNPNFTTFLNTINITGIFEDPEHINSINNSEEDIMDSHYPLEEGLIPQVIEAVVKSLITPKYSPEDNDNNAKDNLPEMVTQPKKNG